MDVGCPKCQTEYELDDARVPEDGVTVKCTSCGHVFRVKRKSLIVTLPVRSDDVRAIGAPAPQDLPPPPPSREWKIRQPSGRLLTCRELTALQKWIIENRVGRDDEISLTGDTWKRLGDIPELASFFQIVDEAAKGRSLEAMYAAAPPPMSSSRTPPPLPNQSSPSGSRRITETWKEPKFPPLESKTEPSMVPPPPPPPSVPPAPQAARRYEPSDSQLQRAVAPQRSGKSLWVSLALLVAAGAGAGWYFLVYLPKQQPVLPVETATPAVSVDAGNEAPVDAGAVAAVTPPLPSAVTEVDAGVAVVDAGAVEPTAPDPVDSKPVEPVAAKHEPKRSFETILNQADQLREREHVEAALNLYGVAHDLRPDRIEPIVGRGLSMLDLGNAVAAQAAFEQALQVNERYGPAIMGLAESLRAQGKNARAIDYYQKYLDVLPDGAEAAVARNNIERLKK